MGEPAFTLLVRNRIHECAPDHSVETVTVGTLREAARQMSALYEALRNVADLVQMYGSASHDLEVREALSLALGESPNA